MRTEKDFYNISSNIRCSQAIHSVKRHHNERVLIRTPAGSYQDGGGLSAASDPCLKGVEAITATSECQEVNENAACGWKGTTAGNALSKRRQSCPSQLGRGLRCQRSRTRRPLASLGARAGRGKCNSGEGTGRLGSCLPGQDDKSCQQCHLGPAHCTISMAWFAIAAPHAIAPLRS